MKTHERSEDCWCTPISVPAERTDGVIDWIYVHHYGEELSPEEQAAWVAGIFEVLDCLKHTSSEDVGIEDEGV